MLWLLEQGERSVGELAEAVGASLQSTSQHLRLLRQHGLVGSRREGQTVFYTIEGQVLPGTTLRLEQPSDDPSSAAEKRRPRPSHKEISHV
jgi:DNA-binding transcriptional ArsR family regulator